LGAAGFGAAAGGRATTGGGLTLIEARCSTCGATAIMAFATGAEAARTVAGTTVAAARLAKCCCKT